MERHSYGRGVRRRTRGRRHAADGDQRAVERVRPRGRPVIPVLLPSFNAEAVDLPVFLKHLTWVDFRKAEPERRRRH